MPSYNKTILVGNLTRDVELRHISSGTAITEIGLAINDKVKKVDQWIDETTFVDVVLWGRTAEVAAEYLKKGSTVLIEGRLKLESWEKDGQKRSKLKVVGEKMQMLDSKPNGTKQAHKQAAEPQTQQSMQYSGPADIDIPF